MSPLVFVDPQTAFPLPGTFDFEGYIDTERELWTFFPETFGKRVNFCQLGLTAQVYAEVAESNSPLQNNETYFLMPCDDRTLRPVKMRSTRILTLEEFRMTHLTAVRMMEKLSGTGRVLDEVHRQVLGPEILAENESQ